MLQPEGLNILEWRRLIERLDKVVAEAAREYLKGLHARRIPIRTDSWYQELEELRLAREPAYDRPGLPLVYALKYMPRRVISVLGSLLALDIDRYRTGVLDVGSGSGATALALDLLDAPRHMNLLGIEPSREMIAFADSPHYPTRVTTRYQSGSLGDDTLNRLSMELFDLVVFSATLPYDFDEWDRLLGALGSYEDNLGRTILVVEPEAKADLIHTFGRRLRARGWPTEAFCCHDLPDVMKRHDLRLVEMEKVWKRIGSPWSMPPRTWWTPPNDKFLIANPLPYRQRVESRVSIGGGLVPLTLGAPKVASEHRVRTASYLSNED